MSSKQKIRRSTRRKGGGDTTDTDYTMETDVESVNAEVLSMMNVLEGDDLAPSNQGVIINECVEAGATASRHDDPLGSNVDLPGVHTPQSASRQRRDTPPTLRAEESNHTPVGAQVHTEECMRDAKGSEVRSHTSRRSEPPPSEEPNLLLQCATRFERDTVGATKPEEPVRNPVYEWPRPGSAEVEMRQDRLRVERENRKNTRLDNMVQRSPEVIQYYADDVVINGAIYRRTEQPREQRGGLPSRPVSLPRVTVPMDAESVTSLPATRGAAVGAHVEPRQPARSNPGAAAQTRRSQSDTRTEIATGRRMDPERGDPIQMPMTQATEERRTTAVPDAARGTAGSIRSNVTLPSLSGMRDQYLIAREKEIQAANPGAEVIWSPDYTAYALSYPQQTGPPQGNGPPVARQMTSDNWEPKRIQNPQLARHQPAPAGPVVLRRNPTALEPTTDEYATAAEATPESDYSTSQIDTDEVEVWMGGGLPDHLDDASLWPWRKMRRANKTRRKQNLTERGYRSENDAGHRPARQMSDAPRRIGGDMRAQLKHELLGLKQKEKRRARYRDLLQAEYDRRCDMTASSADEDVPSLQSRSTKIKGRGARTRSEPNQKRTPVAVNGAKDDKYLGYRSEAESTRKEPSATSRPKRTKDNRPGTPLGSDAAEQIFSRSPSPSGSETDAPGVRQGSKRSRSQSVAAVDVKARSKPDGGNLTVSKFSGGNWSAFLNQFEVVADYYGWDDRRKAVALRSAIRGDAADALSDPATRSWNYAQLVEHMEVRHGKQKTFPDIQNELQMMSRRPGQTLTSWHDEVVRVVNSASLTESERELLNFIGFTGGLRANRHLHNRITVDLEKRTIDEAYKRAKAYEREYGSTTHLTVMAANPVTPVAAYDSNCRMPANVGSAQLPAAIPHVPQPTSASPGYGAQVAAMHTQTQPVAQQVVANTLFNSVAALLDDEKVMRQVNALPTEQPVEQYNLFAPAQTSQRQAKQALLELIGADTNPTPTRPNTMVAAATPAPKVDLSSLTEKIEQLIEYKDIQEQRRKEAIEKRQNNPRGRGRGGRGRFFRGGRGNGGRGRGFYNNNGYNNGYNNNGYNNGYNNGFNNGYQGGYNNYNNGYNNGYNNYNNYDNYQGGNDGGWNNDQNQQGPQADNNADPYGMDQAAAFQNVDQNQRYQPQQQQQQAAPAAAPAAPAAATAQVAAAQPAAAVTSGAQDARSA